MITFLILLVLSIRTMALPIDPKASSLLPNDSKCQNGGICMLDNDFCVCDFGLTGRFCEFKLTNNDKNDQDYEETKSTVLAISFDQDKNQTMRKSCGNLLMNGQSEYVTNRVYCKCINQVLTCQALVSSSKEFDLVGLRGTDEIELLVQLERAILDRAYQIYIKEIQLKYATDLDLVLVDVDEEIEVIVEDANKPLQLTVFKSKRDIVGLHFHNNKFHLDIMKHAITSGEKNRIASFTFILVLALKGVFVLYYASF